MEALSVDSGCREKGLPEEVLRELDELPKPEPKERCAVGTPIGTGVDAANVLGTVPKDAFED